jgi:hypothetical protein
VADSFYLSAAGRKLTRETKSDLEVRLAGPPPPERGGDDAPPLRSAG